MAPKALQPRHFVQSLGFSGIQAGAQEILVEVFAAYVSRMGAIGRKYAELGTYLYHRCIASPGATQFYLGDSKVSPTADLRFTVLLFRLAGFVAISKYQPCTLFDAPLCKLRSA